MNEYRPSSFQILPPVIKNLIIINVLVLMAQSFLGEKVGDMLMDNFALHYWSSPLFRPWQVVTYLFMHGGFTHLLGNMFALWMFGSVLENRWGPKRFLAFYFICGIGAALCQMLYGQYQLGGLASDYKSLMQNFDYQNFKVFANKYDLQQYPALVQYANFWKQNPTNPEVIDKVREITNAITSLKINEPSVGASGSVFGILVAFGYLFPNTYLYFYFLFPIKAKWFVIGYILLELYLGIQNNNGDNVAHAAHIGGGIVGFLIVYLWNKRDRKNFY